MMRPSMAALAALVMASPEPETDRWQRVTTNTVRPRKEGPPWTRTQERERRRRQIERGMLKARETPPASDGGGE